ncbi:hypothetical protein N6H14_17750 [Paenibacillus sp. CC-CFT747]|nr:hypothetical protein N6H14_17750 [Paenibacillus sp. CC-CFT747]
MAAASSRVTIAVKTRVTMATAIRFPLPDWAAISGRVLTEWIT